MVNLGSNGLVNNIYNHYVEMTIGFLSREISSQTVYHFKLIFVPVSTVLCKKGTRHRDKEG